MKLLLTGGCGFIGSNLTRTLIDNSDIDSIIILDNLSTGYKKNIEEFRHHKKVHFANGDIRDIDLCQELCQKSDAVCHQAALGSVPRSVKDPISTNDHNIQGTLNIFTAARDQGIKRVVYASSSSVYGDEETMPKVEQRVGRPLSPYAVTKKAAELYADNFGSLYGMEMIGLRYFNIFGPNQSPDGPYAAVLPLFIQALLNNEPATINGDGSFSRDFTYVDNAVQANIKALFTTRPESINQVYNIACGYRTTLSEIWKLLNEITGKNISPIHGPERQGDIPHSLADISKAKSLLDYSPNIKVRKGLEKTVEYFKKS